MYSKWLIYALVDPRDGEVFYVGRSSSGLDRPRSHFGMSAIRDLGTFHVTRTCRQILAVGLEPEIKVLEEHPSGPDLLNDSEKRFIREMRASGCRLTNITDGGDGTNGWVPSAETRAKISASNTGRSLSAEHRSKLSKARLGKRATPEARANQSASQRGTYSQERRDWCRALGLSSRGRTHSAETRRLISEGIRNRPTEWRAKLSAIRTGATTPEATRKKLSIAMKGRVFSEESRARMRAAQQLRRSTTTTSAETRAKISAASMNRSPETRARMSASQRARKATPETREKMRIAHLARSARSLNLEVKNVPN